MTNSQTWLLLGSLLLNVALVGGWAMGRTKDHR